LRATVFGHVPSAMALSAGSLTEKFGARSADARAAHDGCAHVDWRVIGSG